MEINQKRLELLQNVMADTLTSAINERHPEAPIKRFSEEELFSRLPDLYDVKKEVEFGQETGREYKYMPKHYKEMVLRLIAPFAGFQYRIDCNEAGYSVTALLYLDCREKDQNPVSIGEAFVSFASVDQNMTEDEKKSFAKATAKGLAESKAMQKFGIGIWHTYQYEPEENPDEAEAQLQRNQDQTYADPVGTNSKEPVSSEKGQKAEEIDNPLTQDKDTQTQENTPESETVKPKRGRKPKAQTVEENSVTETVDEQEDVGSDQDMPLEKALELPADCGKAQTMELTLGATAAKYPGNIYWMYCNDDVSELNKKAIEVIVRNNPSLAQLFKERGNEII